ncbi:cobyric acid synthase CbiP [methanogenic archaeon mixed culture ISO4-G1]|nr:cobyric acid synthase CbiP [methanogenic archaeon mixed culture ISO4-G1]
MSILFLGTSSGAGKTTVCAMMCRYLSRNGVDVVPFKGSNLSLNSIATKDGGEIGMGQAFQAWAAGVEPETDMNPVLLKPSGKGVMQLVLNGKPHSDITKDKPMDREIVMDEAVKALRRLEEKHQLVLCEGSGSPVELNLIKTDIANVGLMRAAQVPAVLVGDIEKGGVFAALYGTWRLIPDDVRPLLKGFIINRFRGDASILGSAIERIEELTGMKCLGVLRYEYLRFPEEDSLSYSEGKLEGNDLHAAFLSNLDEMIAHAEEDGFDFGSMKKMAGL